jgi:hypothetical protein
MPGVDRDFWRQALIDEQPTDHAFVSRRVVMAAFDFPGRWRSGGVGWALSTRVNLTVHSRRF